MWLRIRSGGRATVVAAHDTTHAAVALSADGREAILGGRNPVIGRFGAGTGASLPMRYVSSARIGRARIYIESRYSANGQARGVLKALSDDLGVVWSKQVQDGFANVNARVSLLAYAVSAGAPAALVDLGSGKERPLAGKWDDVAPVSGALVFGVRSSGQVERLPVAAD